MRKCCFLELLFLYCFSLRQNTRFYTDIQMVIKQQNRLAKFIDRQNQSVQKRLLPYVCLPNLCPSGLSVWV